MFMSLSFQYLSCSQEGHDVMYLLMFALREYWRGMEGNAKSEAPEAWSPKRVGRPTERVGAWTVAEPTATEVSPLAPKNKNNGNRTNGKERGRGGENSEEKPGETTVTRAARKRRRAYQARRPPARLVARARPGCFFAKH